MIFSTADTVKPVSDRYSTTKRTVDVTVFGGGGADSPKKKPAGNVDLATIRKQIADREAQLGKEQQP